MHYPLVLIILDGWGHSSETKFNAIAAADTPTLDNLTAHAQSCTLIKASGAAVGLPPGQMGNSEVGHLCLGSGRVVPQQLMRINRSIQSGDFAQNTAYLGAIAQAHASGGAVHVIGLLSPGGVHSHEEHIHAAVRLAATSKPCAVYVHALLDGRDTPPRSAVNSLRDMQELCATLSAERDGVPVSIASICGRYYAMDRDKRWERTEQAWRLLVEGHAPHRADNAVDALENAYQRGESDEFVVPTTVKPARCIESRDAVLFMNFRADRARQLCHALCDGKFDSFERSTHLSLGASQFVMTTNYDDNLEAACAFPKDDIVATLGEHLSLSGHRQLRLAETEKYAHVTFFFNGGREEPFPGEERILVPSPKVATYDLQPEMSAIALTDQLVAAIQDKKHQFIVCNYANGDMVGHTGVFDAAVKAVSTVDACIARVIKGIRAVNGECLITADHGNCEQMHDTNNAQAHTAHTAHLVPFIYSGPRALKMHSDGGLSDVAPSVLKLMNLEQPPDMTGKPLFDFVRV